MYIFIKEKKLYKYTGHMMYARNRKKENNKTARPQPKRLTSNNELS
jgi:hypothetical protein